MYVWKSGMFVPSWTPDYCLTTGVILAGYFVGRYHTAIEILSRLVCIFKGRIWDVLPSRKETGDVDECLREAASFCVAYNL